MKATRGKWTSGGRSEGRASRVLVVDDVEGIRVALQECLRVNGYEVVSAASGMEALDCLRREQFDLLLTDQAMPGLSGLELTEEAVRIHPNIPVVLLTGHTDVDLARASLRAGASDFITKPINIQELPIVIERNLTRRRLEIARLKEREAQVLFAAIKALASAVDAKDPYTARHSMGVSRLSLALLAALGLAGDERYVLELAAWMHDVGKIGVPDTILTKPAALTEDEVALVRAHPVKGSEIVGQIAELREVATAIRHHHERFDGRGYPDGLAGHAIPLTSRIIAVADAFEAMTADRSYRRGMGIERAVAELQKHRSLQFDPLLVDVFTGDVVPGLRG
ncbi:MAG: response regulator [candidate division NC10 bacterium]|nr:response regulator [candidate division NC10 bacterium]